jgi:hypothetical protein
MPADPELAPIWRVVFRQKGFFNMASAVIFIAGVAVSEPFAEWTRTDTAGSMMYFDIFLAHAFFFGAIYWWMADHPLRHRAILYLSIPIEISFMSIVLGNAIAGVIPVWLIIPGLQDGLCAVLFTILLRNNPEPARG